MIPHDPRWRTGALIALGLIAYAIAWAMQWSVAGLPQRATGRSSDPRFVLQYVVGVCFLLAGVGVWRRWTMRGHSLVAVSLGLIWLFRANLERTGTQERPSGTMEQQLAMLPMAHQLVFLFIVIAGMLYVGWLIKPNR